MILPVGAVIICRVALPRELVVGEEVTDVAVVVVAVVVAVVVVEVGEVVATPTQVLRLLLRVMVLGQLQECLPLKLLHM